MHGAIARTPRLIASCTTGAARSTSHVVKMMSAPWPSSFAAHDLATVGLLPCVSQVLISSFRPLTPPFAFTVLTRSCAAASAGPSNGAIAPLLSNAQPIVIGAAAADCVRAAAVAASPSATTTAMAAASERELIPLIQDSLLVGRRGGATDVGGWDTRVGLRNMEIRQRLPDGRDAAARRLGDRQRP